MLNDQAVGLAGRVWQGAPRHRLRAHHAAGFDYHPQLADLLDAKLWRILAGTDHGPLNAAARCKLDLARIQRQWPDILRVVASIHTGAVAVHDILKVLAPGGTPTQLGDALAHYGRIFKTLHVLSYVDDEPYRREKGMRNLQEGRHDSPARCSRP